MDAMNHERTLGAPESYDDYIGRVDLCFEDSMRTIALMRNLAVTQLINAQDVGDNWQARRWNSILDQLRQHAMDYATAAANHRKAQHGSTGAQAD